MINKDDLAALRLNYTRHRLDENSVNIDPFEQFAAWFDEALKAHIVEPNAMLLGTSSVSCRPAGRMVLLKRFDHAGFSFFTNYKSAKAADLIENPQCFIHFFWKELERQVIVNGVAHKVSSQESDDYFAIRPRESQLGAWASEQSSEIQSRDIVERRFEELHTKYQDKTIPRPPFWGGFRIVPNRFEFWQGRPSRLHDRIVYLQFEDQWAISRLSP